MIHWVLCTRPEPRAKEDGVIKCEVCDYNYDPEHAVVIRRTVDGKVTSLCPKCAHVNTTLEAKR